jgi:hypothetical protein
LRIGAARIVAHRTVAQKTVVPKTALQKIAACRGLGIRIAECSGTIHRPTTAEDKGTTRLRKYGIVAMVVRVGTRRGRRMLVRSMRMHRGRRALVRSTRMGRAETQNLILATTNTRAGRITDL